MKNDELDLEILMKRMYGMQENWSGETESWKNSKDTSI